MDDLLPKLKDKIKNKISNLNFNTWFSPISKTKLSDNLLILTVPNKFIADWINDYYLELIKQSVFELTSQDCRVTYDIVGEEPAQTQIKAQPVPQATIQPPQQKSIRVRSIDALNPKYSFDRFVVGSGNQFAHAACKAVSDLPGGHYNPLFLYGGVGLGKTHLLHAVGLQIAATRPEFQLIYVSAEKFMNELINALRYEKMPDFRKKFRDHCDILLIDDIQFIGGKDRTQEEFFHTFNTLHDSHKQIVVTSDKLPKDLQGIEERLRSRFEWGLIADIGPPDLETRIAILKKKAELSNLSCPNDVAMFLASSIKSNVRELEGSLIRINAFASLTGAHISVELAHEVLGESLRQSELRCSIEAVQKIVADFYKINVTDLKSPKKIKLFSYPRQVAMYLCKKHVKSSFPEIGNKFGGKDHTTVIHACRKIEKLLESDSMIQQDISTLEKSLLH